jgi:hypothetical protein
MPQLLPFEPSIPNQRVATTLDGTQFVFDVRWNGRAACWFMDILDADAEPIVMGIAVVIGAMLGRRSVDPRGPAGFIMAEDTSGTGLDAGLDDLGTRVRVLFFTGDEFYAAAETV